MKKLALRKQLIEILHIKNASPEMQDTVLVQMEEVAQKRLMALLPELLSEAQLKELDGMIKSDKSDDEIMQWLEEKVPQLDDVLKALLLDLAEDIAKKNEKII